MSGGGPAALGGSRGRERDRYLAAVLLPVMVGVGLWLRLRNLGALGLILDEGIQALAVRGVLEHGIPLLDSGTVYRRDPVFLYLQSATVGFFELSLFWLRLPSAIFGAAVVIPVYQLGRLLFDRNIGLLAAVLMTFSVWGIELSRYGRPYTAFQLMYLVSLLCFYRGFMRGERSYRPWFLIAALVTFATHHLSLALVASFLLPLPLAGRSWKQRAELGLWGAGTLALWGVYLQVIGRLTATGPESDAVAAVSVPTNLIAKLHALVGLPGFVGPDLTLLTEVARLQPLLLAGIGVAPAVASVYLVYRAVRGDGAGRCLVAIAATWAAFFSQFALALILLGIYLVLPRRDSADLPLRAAGLAVVICLFGWLARVLLEPALTWKQRVLTMFGFPDLIHSFLYWFVIGWPVMASVVAVGAVRLLVRFRADRTDPVPLLLVGGVGVPAVLASCFRAFSEIRYTFHLYPLIVLVFCWVAIGAWSVVRRWSPSSPWPRRLAALLAVALTLVISQDANPVAAWRVAERTYQSARDPVRGVTNWRPYAGFHQDQEGPSRYVRDRRRPGDQVLALGPVHLLGNYHFYAGGVEYTLVPADAPYYFAVSTADRVVNYVTGSELVAGQAGIEALVAEYAGRLWILGDRKLLAEDNAFYSEPLKETLRRLVGDPEYLGRDGQTFAARVPAGQARPEARRVPGRDS